MTDKKRGRQNVQNIELRELDGRPAGEGSEREHDGGGQLDEDTASHQIHNGEVNVVFKNTFYLGYIITVWKRYLWEDNYIFRLINN